MDPQSLSRDFREFLQFLNEHAVEYLLIGGHAVALHGYPRATSDLDVWIGVSEVNAQRLTKALQRFGFDLPEVTPALFLQPDRIIRMGVPPNQIEILTGIDGVQFSDCYPRRVTLELNEVPVCVISSEDLKINKRASGRNKDLADLDELP